MASYLDPVTTLSGVEDPFAARMRRDFLESAFDLAATPHTGTGSTNSRIRSFTTTS